MAKYQMQVKVDVGENKKKWRSIHPSNSGVPYEYATKAAAERMLDMCYPDLINNEEKRVIEVK